MTSGNSTANCVVVGGGEEKEQVNAHTTTNAVTTRTTKPRNLCCCCYANAEQIPNHYYSQQLLQQEQRANCLSTASYKKTTTPFRPCALSQSGLLSNIRLVQRQRQRRARRRTKGQKSDNADHDETRLLLDVAPACEDAPDSLESCRKRLISRYFDNFICLNRVDDEVQRQRSSFLPYFVEKLDEGQSVPAARSESKNEEPRQKQSHFTPTNHTRSNDPVVKIDEHRFTTDSSHYGVDRYDAGEELSLHVLTMPNRKPIFQSVTALLTPAVVATVVVGLLISCCFHMVPSVSAASANKAGVGHIGFPSLHRRPLTPFDYRPGSNMRGTTLGRKGIGQGGSLRINLLYSDDGFEIYDKMMPPFGTKVMTPIVLSVFVEALNDVNEFHEEISVFFWVTVRWFDPRLEWDPEEWNGTEVLMFRPHDIWVPRLVFDEQLINFENLCRYHNIIRQAGVETFFLTSAVIHTTYNGECSMRGTIITNMKCSMLTRKFPFDSQICKVTFFSMQNENITAVKSNLEAWSTSIAEWTTADIRVVKATGVNCYKDKDDEGLGSGIDYCYSLVNYAIKMHRHPMQHVLVWIVPSNIMALVAFIGLFVGCDAGERFSFGSSIMISINIYLIALSERLPVSRDSVPILGWKILDREPCNTNRIRTPECVVFTVLLYTYTANYYFAMFTLICSAICVSSVSQNYRTFVLGSSSYPVPGHTSTNNLHNQQHCKYNVKNICTTHTEHPVLAAARINAKQSSRFLNAVPTTASTSLSAAASTSAQRDLECGNPCDDLACPTYRPSYWKKHSIPSLTRNNHNNTKSPSPQRNLKLLPTSTTPLLLHELPTQHTSLPNGRSLTGTAAASPDINQNRRPILANNNTNSLPAAASNKKQRTAAKQQQQPSNRPPRLLVSSNNNSCAAAFNPSSHQCTCPDCFDSPTGIDDDENDNSPSKTVTVASPYVERSTASNRSPHRSPYNDTGQQNTAKLRRRNMNKLARTMSSGQTVTCGTHLRTRLKAQRNIILGYASKFDIFLLLVCFLLQLTVNLVAFYYWTSDDDDDELKDA